MYGVSWASGSARVFLGDPSTCLLGAVIMDPKRGSGSVTDEVRGTRGDGSTHLTVGEEERVPRLTESGSLILGNNTRFIIIMRWMVE